ncbi:MAG: oligosaccharide flippase family protein [Clostridia bacterium]|nr:oligosaccharide flippase family protein [Clostridia bacterium]
MKSKFKILLGKLRDTGFFHVFGSSTINKIIGFASGIILVRIISKSEYGVFSYANNTLSFFLLAGGLGATFGVLQMGSEESDTSRKKAIYNYGCYLSFFSNVIIGFVILAVSLFFQFKIPGVNKCLALMAFLPCVSLIYEMQGIYLRTELRNKEYAVSNSVTTILFFILSCGLSLLFSAVGLIAAKYLASILAFLYIAFRYGVKYPIKKQTLSAEDKKAFWKISSISMVNNSLSRLMYLLDIFVLGLVIPDSTVVASYRTATNIPTALAFIPAAVITYIYPYFAKKKDDKVWVKKKYLQITALLGIGSAAIAILMFVFAPFIIKTLFGAAYEDSIPAFKVLSISFALSSTFRILPGNILVTQRKLPFNLVVAVISSAVNTGLNVIMIRAYGAIGAAYATIITVVISGALNVVYLFRVLKEKNKTISGD